MSAFWKIIGGYTCSVLVSGARGKVWGSDEVNVEDWKALSDYQITKVVRLNVILHIFVLQLLMTL